MVDNIYRERALANPDKPVFIMAGSGRTVTAMELENRANQGARLLRSLGLQPGDHIAILMENNLKLLDVCVAASRSGIFYTPISTFLKQDEIEFILNDSGAKVIFTSKAMSNAASKILDQTPGLEARYMCDGVVDGYQAYEEALAAQTTKPIADQIQGFPMLYSSGTTGRPKGIKVALEEKPYGELPPEIAMMMAVFGINEDTVYLSPAPLYHSAPLAFVLLTCAGGGTAVIMEKFDAFDALRAIEKYKVTLSQWVPTMFVRMLKIPEEERLQYDLSSQKLALHAAAPIPIPVKEQMIEWWGPLLLEYYGGTEVGARTMISSEEWLAHKGSVGKAIMGTVKILDDHFNELPPGEVGTIYFAEGPGFEYHNDDEQTKTAHSPQGWGTVNDVGYMDEEGYLYLTDRKTNMIISGGVNIYPQETENILITHPDVLDAAVIGVPNDEFGEEVKGVVQLRNKDQAGDEMARTLISFCESQISKIKCPKSIDFMEELPRTPTGKLLKRLLKEKYWPKSKRI
jgi:fatty-acyl-CoA synthase/long-chain acyl-CoA synthetase